MFRIFKWFLPVFFGLLLLFILELILQKTNVPNYIIPLPSQVIDVLLSDWETILQNSYTTLTEWLIGIILAILLGLFLSICSFNSKLFHSIISPLLIISQSIPYLVFTPILMIWFGLGIAPKVILVVLTCSFPISLVLQNDLLEAKKEYHLVVEMLYIKPVNAFIHIYLPYALPGFFNALKISVSYSFGSAALAELMGSESGLGVYLLRSQATYRTDKMIAAVLIIVIISITSTSLVSLIRKKVVFWKTAKH
ncbi:ABC transporter permease [Fluviispira multicolorata]|uniref:ABC transporter permease subunit n=1 Tax=Fluviispira multicolorata TaxID=2654512 RepID=A0A833N3M7_9BACT|nr:ABC transporter permease subunit [Fluviispira multicolorata]KAB8029999.1 ABC transporter permease subunit [Fluviispira multicolorata]